MPTCCPSKGFCKCAITPIPAAKRLKGNGRETNVRCYWSPTLVGSLLAPRIVSFLLSNRGFFLGGERRAIGREEVELC